MNPFKILEKTKLPVAYMKFDEEVEPPFIVYLGGGAKSFMAENTIYYNENSYIVEFYFEKKSEKKENEIENLLTAHDYLWEKSEDIFISSENLFLIRYFIWE